MIKLWVLAAGFLACFGGVVALRTRRHRRLENEYGSEPVSTEWLAQARGREEHGW